MTLSLILFSMMAVFFVFTAVGFCLLQAYLSKKGKGLGLILPTASFLFSLLLLFPGLMLVNGSMRWVTVGSLPHILALVIFNIPTVVFFIIFYYYHLKAKRAKDLNKMSIYDLE